MTNPFRCWWAARRLDRYLDADPSAELGSTEAARLERHLDTCRRCSAALAGRRALRALLRAVDGGHPADPAALARLDAVASRLRAGRSA